MAVNFKKIVYSFVYIDLFLIFFVLKQCQSEYVPTLIWTSPEFINRKNPEDLVLNKIKSDLFESYLLEVIGSRNPIISVFLEEQLGVDDLEWKDESNFKLFPYLSNLSVYSRVDYFRTVENPNEVFTRLSKKISKVNKDENFEEFESNLLLIEFKKIDFSREEVLTSHDKIIKNVNQRLNDSGRDWLCVYTGKQSSKKKVVSEIKEMSSWHVDHHFYEKQSKVISIYEDRLTKLALITRGSIQLLLPSPKNLAYKNLDQYKKVTVIKKENSTDFVIWFLNYTLTLDISKTENKWIILSAKIVNEKGDSLHLYPSSMPSNNKELATEFQSQGKPFVKIKLNKYKFLRIQYFKEPCDNTFHFQVTAICTTLILLCALLFWYSVTKSLDFSVKTKIVKIPLESLISSKREHLNHFKIK